MLFAYLYLKLTPLSWAFSFKEEDRGAQISLVGNTPT